jgi:hypothetical protein
MQILYAAPFLLVAALGFFLCASVSRLQKKALVLPVGVLAFGVGSLVFYFIFALIADKIGYHGSANWICIVPYIGGGLLASITCSRLFRSIVTILPRWLISLGLVAATFASSLVCFLFCSFALAQLPVAYRSHTYWLALGVGCFSIALVSSWRIVSISERFVPDPEITRGKEQNHSAGC